MSGAASSASKCCATTAARSSKRSAWKRDSARFLRYRIHPADPSTARAEADYELIHRHAHGWDTTIRTRSAIGCTAEYYLLEADLEAFEGEERIFSRSWSERIPRDFT